MRTNFLAILACAVGTALAALMPAKAQVANGRATTAAPTYANNSTAPLSLDLSGNLRVALDAVADAVQVVGNVAHDAVDSGNPVKVGGFASSTTPTPVAASDRVNAWYGLSGAQMVGGLSVTPADNASNLALSLPASSGAAAAPLQVFPFVFDGSTWDRMPGTSAGGVSTTVIGALPAGANNIGDVDVLTLPSIPAGTNTIGKANAPQSGVTGASGLIANTATVMLGSPTSLDAINWATVTTAVVVSVYDNATACTGTIRVAIRLTTEGSMVFPTPITFTNGMTACTNAGTVGVGYMYH